MIYTSIDVETAKQKIESLLPIEIREKLVWRENLDSKYVFGQPLEIILDEFNFQESGFQAVVTALNSRVRFSSIECEIVVDIWFHDKNNSRDLENNPYGDDAETGYYSRTSFCGYFKNEIGRRGPETH